MKTPGKATPDMIPFDQPGIVLDVRTQVEHASLSLKQPHRHIPLDKLNPAAFIKETKIDPAQPVYFLCRSGKRATQAAEAFIAAGHDNVHVIEGGILACESAGIPLKKGNVMSLERQVRIAAGSLVVTGVVLGSLMSPGFYTLAGIIGAGLVFAGITNSCGMAFLLTRAPWNKNLPPAEKAESCGIKNTACTTSSRSEEPPVKMPGGTVFYSPAHGKPEAPQMKAQTKATERAGGCS